MFSKYIYASLLAACVFPVCIQAQELYVYTEPASNMASKSIGIRLNNYLYTGKGQTKAAYMIAPEVMLGISKKIMVHGESFFFNRGNGFGYSGSSTYMKYRFFSQDQVHSHFRMAASGKLARSVQPVMQPAIDFNGMNSGYELGVVATKLVNKWAFSGGASIVHAWDNAGEKNYTYPGRNAVDYSLSLGKLTLPKEYISYDQLNMNLMLEALGQVNTTMKSGYLDLAPSVQFIIKSQTRVDVGYRFPVNYNLQRTQDRGFLLRIEYNIFNAWK